MQLIKLNATESTNTYLKHLMASEDIPDLTVVVTEEQTKGRGQTEALWESEPAKNLTFSMLKRWEGIRPQHQFIISICVSLAIYKALSTLNVPQLKIKWPNDIMSGTSKICGILIENSITGSKIKTSIIGIGLNVNQTVFSKHLKASSLKLLLAKTTDLDKLLTKILRYLRTYLLQANMEHWEELYTTYERVLFLKDVPATFQKPDGQLFMGIIRGVSKEGKLNVSLENDIIEKFDLKEVKLRY